jgi:hypothetical protein
MTFVEYGNPKMDIIINMLDSDDFKRLSIDDQIINIENLSKKIFTHIEGEELEDLITYVINFITRRHINFRIVGTYLKYIANSLCIVLKMRTGGPNWDKFIGLNDSLKKCSVHDHQDEENKYVHVFYFDVYELPNNYKELMKENWED